MIHDPQHIINQLPEWLRADHWTRHLLLGRGIVCNYTIQLIDDCTFRVCSGVGVTSDGTLVTAPKKDYLFTHHRPYATPDYPFFQGTDEVPVDLWEVLEGRPAGSGPEVQPLTPQNETEKLNLFIADKVLLLYLEPLPDTGDHNPDVPPIYQQEDIEPNVPPAAGGETPYRLRWLLMRQADVLHALDLYDTVADIVAARGGDDDYVYSEGYSTDDERIYETDILQAADPRLAWAEIPLRRLGWGCKDPFACTPEELDQSDFPHIQNLDDLYAAYVCVIDAATKALDREGKKLLGWLNDHHYCFAAAEWEDWFEQLCQKWEAFKALNQVNDTTRHRKEMIQYFYDWCRDLLAAYHELRCTALRWRAKCCPDVQAHPRHLLLGLLMRESLPYYPAALRHHYRQPPVYNDMAERAQRIRLYHQRLLLLIRGFYLPYALPEQAINPFCHYEEMGDTDELPVMDEVRVTPSRYYDQRLGLWSIPYYYPLSESRFSVHRSWDWCRSRTLRIDHHRSYHARAEDGSYTQLPRATHPLRYNIDNDSFFRIEGHIGRSREEVEPTLDNWRRKYNLAYDIIYRRIDDLTEAGVTLDGETFNTMLDDLAGAEHLAGVRAGGTFIVVYDTAGKVVADFSLPYRCCRETIKEPPSDDPPTTTDGELTGQVISCQGEPLVGATVALVDTTHTVETVEKGEFILVAPPGDYTLHVQMDGYLSQQATASVTDGATNDVGTIELLPEAITLTGVVTRSANPLGDVVVQAQDIDGNPVEDITDSLGTFTLPNVPRAISEVVLVLNEQVQSPPFTFEPGAECDTKHVEIEMLRRGAVIVVDYEPDVRITNEVLTAWAVTPDSVEATSVRAFYGDRIHHYAEAYNTALAVPALQANDNLTAVSENLSLIVNDGTASTTKVHNAYKAALDTLDAEMQAAASAEEKEALLSVADSVNHLYLYRIAENQPTDVTAGTTNALKKAGEIGGGQIDITKTTTAWSDEVRGKVNATVVEKLKHFSL